MFDNKDKELHCEWYQNSDFTNLVYKYDCKNYSNNTCDRYVIFNEKQQNIWYSIIAKWDDSINKPIHADYYKNKDFTDLYCKIDYVYNEDNSYIRKLLYFIPNNGILSEIQYLNSENKLLKGLYYKDNNFCELSFTEKFKYNNDGNFIKYGKYKYPSNDEILSFIENFDYKNRCLTGQYYKNYDYTNLTYKTNYKYRLDGSFKIIFIYEIQNKDNELSKIETYNKAYKKIDEKTFFDKDFKQIRMSSSLEHHNDGSYLEKTKTNFDKLGLEYSITESHYDEHGKKIKEYSKLYERNKLQGKYEKFLNEDGTYTCKIISNNSDMPSCINIYDNNENMLSSKAYKDANFKTLIAVKKLEYLNNGGYREYISYAIPTCNGCLSEIEEYDSEGNFQTGKYFKDSNYKEIISEE